MEYLRILFIILFIILLALIIIDLSMGCEVYLMRPDFEKLMEIESPVDTLVDTIVDGGQE